jgi:hypothetical protein
MTAREKTKTIAARMAEAGRTIDPCRIAELAKDPSPSVRRRLAIRSQAIPEILLALPEDQDGCVRRIVASMPGAPEDIVERLAQDRLSSVRAAAARNPRLSDATLAAMAGGERNAGVLRSLGARRPSSPAVAEILLSRKGNRGAAARSALAILDDPLDDETMEALARSSAEEVRTFVAFHPLTKAAILRRLAKDEAPAVANALLARTDLDADALKNLSKNSRTAVVMAIASRTFLPKNVLDALVGHRARLVRRNLAGRKKPREADQRILSEDPELDVRIAVARNRLTPADVLLELATEDNDGLEPKFSALRNLAALSGHEKITALAGLIERKPHLAAAASEAIAEIRGNDA